MADTTKLEADRQILLAAQEKGGAAKLGAFIRLSGPGWLQSAITLGGGSLAGALFLGILGGTNMLWLQLVAIIMGVVMLSAISYVTLSTGKRPFREINEHINPALGWGWLIATSMANMIWCMPQFGLCYEALDRNLVPGGLTPGTPGQPATDGEVFWTRIGVSFAILVVVGVVVALNARRGLAARIFDWLLKALVGMIVVCFFGVVAYLTYKGELAWGSILTGFIPDFSQWTRPTGDVAFLIQNLPAAEQNFWSARIVGEQRSTLIAAAATAVGINMTFLMPYTMLHRGWDKTFRGLARFDLCTGMAIPYILVTSCVVIAAAFSFHARAEPGFLSNDPAVFEKSPTFGGAKAMLAVRVRPYLGKLNSKKLGDSLEKIQNDEPQKWQGIVADMAALPESEKKIASSLVRRKSHALATALAPLIGKENANRVFGLGVFGMGFSTIIILMLINGFVFCEAAGKPEGGGLYVAGCLVAGVVGALWPVLWAQQTTNFWLSILASTFGMMLLPIAYITFFMMMNSRAIMGDEKPKGISMTIWNLLMAISVAGAIAAAGTSIYDKVTDPKNPLGGQVVLVVLGIYVLLVIAGFFMTKKGAAKAK